MKKSRVLKFKLPHHVLDKRPSVSGLYNVAFSLCFFFSSHALESTHFVSIHSGYSYLLLANEI